ncbi:MAG: aminoacyl-tRNA deacylase [Kiritimatiellia bacterium]
MTPAIRALKAAKVEYTAYQHDYEPHGGTALCARQMGISEHHVIKTIVLKTDEGAPLIMLQHGDAEISLKQLARILGAKRVEACTVPEAERASGYFVGGTSPFGFRKRVPVYAEASIFDLDWIVINGGARGFFVKIAPEVLRTVVAAKPVEAMQAV